MSSKREIHRQAVRPLLLAALNSPGLLSPREFKMARYSLSTNRQSHLLDPDIAALEDYLIDHSNLPGRRANLELVGAFADEVASLCTMSDIALNRSYVAMEWLLWILMSRYPPVIFGCDPDSPLQMPQFCGVVAFGEWAITFRHIEAGVSTLFGLADSPLWRVREGVALGFQRMLYHAWSSTMRRVQRQTTDIGPYQWRAAVAGVAELALLADPEQALDALDLHYAALSYLRRRPPSARRSDALRTLRKTLGYTLSVVVAATPEAGLAQMRAWATWDDADVRWVLRENLKKKRLSAWAEEVQQVRASLGE